jgi:hypothetical protein
MAAATMFAQFLAMPFVCGGLQNKSRTTASAIRLAKKIKSFVVMESIIIIALCLGKCKSNINY